MSAITANLTLAAVREKRVSRSRRFFSELAFGLSALTTAAYVQLRCPGIPDGDAFYHLRHASLYVLKGPFLTGFPWTAYSVISQFAADNWYGFHLLLTPFSLIRDPFWAIKGAGIFLITALLLCLWWAGRKLEFIWPWLWPFGFLLADPGGLWRMLMTRPHVLTLGLTALLFAFLLRGRYLQVGLIALLLTFFHLNFFWVAPLLAVVVLVVKGLSERIWPVASTLGALAGTILGGLLRPNPWGAMKLLDVQIFQLFQVKAAGLPLLFGSELYPLEPRRLLALLLGLWLSGAALTLWVMARKGKLSPQPRTLLLSSLVLSVIFFEMTTRVSRRAADLWLLFVVFFGGAAVTVLFSRREGAPRSRLQWIGIAVGGPLFIYLAVSTLQKNTEVFPIMLSPYRLAEAGEWLRKNTPPGSIVFNPHWDDFPELFYWDPQNRYIGGMDPIFQYAYSPALYWKAHHLAKGDSAAFTCGALACSAENQEDTFKVLRRDFKSSYILLNRQRDAGLLAYVKSDPRFTIKFEDPQLVIAALGK